MKGFSQDLKYAARMMARTPVFSLVIILTLAMGISATAAIFTIVNAIFLRPLPVQEPGELVRIFTVDSKNRGDRDLRPTSYPNFEDYRDKNRAFSGIYAATILPVNFVSSGVAEQIQAEIVSGSYFQVLGVKAELGRIFYGDEDKVPAADPVVVLNHTFWKTHFGSNPDILGKKLTLNGYTYTMIGVAPPAFRGTNLLSGPDVWVPMMMHEQLFTTMPQLMFGMRRALQFDMVGRLRPGTSRARAESEMQSLAVALESAYPVPNAGRNVVLVPLVDATINPDQRGSHIRASQILMLVVALVLLIVCANIANLLLARAVGRQREVAVRLAMGANRRRLIRQFFTESMLLASIGGLLGALLAVILRQVLWSFRPQELLHSDLDLSFDWRVVLMTVLVTISTGILFGVGPALHLSRPQLSLALRERTGDGGGHRRLRVQDMIIVSEVMLSVIALIAAGLFLLSLHNAQQLDVGFNPQNLLVASFDLDAQRYKEPQAQQYFQDARERLQGLPGVRSVAVSSSSPLLNQGFMRTIFPEGEDGKAATKGTFSPVAHIGPGYFNTMQIALMQGRDFTDADGPQTTQVAIVNERAAKVFWPNQNPIGRRFKFFGDDNFTQVVGVARDGKYQSLGEAPTPYIYVPVRQNYFQGAMTVHVRTASDPKALISSVRSTLQTLDSHVPLFDVVTLDQVMERALWAPRMGARLFTIFGVTALLLACMGVYGVMAYSIRQRVNEIGVRLALGATRVDIFNLIVGRGMTIVGAGIVAGVIGALAMSHLISSLLYGTGGINSEIYAIVCFVLSVVALISCVFPAILAARIDPMVALRNE
jgi:predicted permease